MVHEYVYFYEYIWKSVYNGSHLLVTIYFTPTSFDNIFVRLYNTLFCFLQAGYVVCHFLSVMTDICQMCLVPDAFTTGSMKAFHVTCFNT